MRGGTRRPTDNVHTLMVSAGDIPIQTISNYMFFNSFQVTNILVKSLETTSLTELNIAWRKAGVSEEIVFEAGQKYAIKDQSTNMVGL